MHEEFPVGSELQHTSERWNLQVTSSSRMLFMYKGDANERNFLGSDT